MHAARCTKYYHKRWCTLPSPTRLQRRIVFPRRFATLALSWVNVYKFLIAVKNYIDSANQRLCHVYSYPNRASVWLASDFYVVKFVDKVIVGSIVATVDSSLLSESLNTLYDISLSGLLAARWEVTCVYLRSFGDPSYLQVRLKKKKDEKLRERIQPRNFKEVNCDEKRRMMIISTC